MESEPIRRIFASNLQRLFEEKGMQKNALADFVGVSDNTITNWTHGHKMPRMDKIDKICSFFGVRRSALLEMPVALNADTAREVGSPVAAIPIYGRIVAGEPIEAVQEVIGHTYIERDKAASGQYFALKVFGASMEPTVTDGDIIIVHKQESVDNGQIAVVLIENEATVKRIYSDRRGLSIVADNASVFPPRLYTNEEVESMPIRILGRAVNVSHEL